MSSPALDTDVAIETPEHIVFRYRVAGPARRAIAYVIDLIVCYVALFVVALIVTLATAGSGGVSGAMDGVAGAGIGLLLLAIFAVQWLYFAVLEAWRGVTPGKRAMGLRVVTTEGRPIGIRESAIRNVLRAADALPMTLAGGALATFFGGVLSVAGGTSMALTRRFQRLGDLAAGTIVVMTERAVAGDSVALWPPATPGEMAALPEVVTLDADERVAIELFLRRCRRIGHARAIELASMIAPTLAKRFDLRVADPVRALALLYDRAANAGRVEGPPSSRGAQSWR